MKNFRGSASAAGVGTPESAPHELLKSSLHFYLAFKHRDFYKKGNDGSISVDRILHEKMDYQRNL